MLEAHRLQHKAQFTIIYIPLIGEPVYSPPSSAAFRASVYAVGIAPTGHLALAVPYHLRVRAHENVLSPAFESFAVGGVEKLVFFPVFSCPHDPVLYLLL